MEMMFTNLWRACWLKCHYVEIWQEFLNQPGDDRKERSSIKLADNLWNEVAFESSIHSGSTWQIGWDDIAKPLNFMDHGICVWHSYSVFSHGLSRSNNVVNLCLDFFWGNKTILAIKSNLMLLDLHQHVWRLNAEAWCFPHRNFPIQSP